MIFPVPPTFGGLLEHSENPGPAGVFRFWAFRTGSTQAGEFVGMADGIAARCRLLCLSIPPPSGRLVTVSGWLKPSVGAGFGWSAEESAVTVSGG